MASCPHWQCSTCHRKQGQPNNLMMKGHQDVDNSTSAFSAPLFYPTGAFWRELSECVLCGHGELFSNNYFLIILNLIIFSHLNGRSPRMEMGEEETLLSSLHCFLCSFYLSGRDTPGNQKNGCWFKDWLIRRDFRAFVNILWGSCVPIGIKHFMFYSGLSQYANVQVPWWHIDDTLPKHTHTCTPKKRLLT